MRWFLGSVFGIFLLFGCSDLTDPPPSSLSSPPSVSTVSELFDGSSGADGANPHFFFLSPLVESPAYSGVADDNLKPVVTVCNVRDLDPISGECPAPLAVFSMDAPNEDDQVSLDPGVKYSVVWKTDRYPAPDYEMFRITVSVLDRALGWLEVKSYPPSVFASFKGTDPEGNVAISSNGSANITFRVEEGALEAAFCERSNIEDCDVLILDSETGGALRVFENPESMGSPLGSQVAVPAGALLEGNPVQGSYAVILQLEKNDVTQPGTIPAEQQVPYFIDLRTDPPGVTFPRPVDQGGPGGIGSEGVQIILCQVLDESALGYVPESLHPFLVIFLTRTGSSGRTTTLLPTAFGAEECEGYAPHSHTTATGSSGASSLLGRFATGLSKLGGFILPRPLMARRLHGGLNTVVWEISGDGFDGRDGGGDDDPMNVSGLSFSLASSGEDVLEFGAVLDVDPDLSNATVTITDPAVVQSETEIYVQVLNAAGEPFPFEVQVTVDVSGANTGTLLAEYLGNGTYRAAYTPLNAGTDTLVVTAYAAGILPFTEIGTFTSEVHPLSGDLVVVVEIAGGAPADGLPVYLYQGTDPTLFGEGVTGSCTNGAPGVSSCSAVFADIEFGSYTAHLPKRDFDVQFASMTQIVEHQQAPNTLTFTGVTQAIPADARVFRVRSGGSGNAFRYVVGGRSWVASNNQVQNDVLLGVQGHLATIHGDGENEFVTGLVSDFCPNVDRQGQCRSRAWLGLRFNTTAGRWEWVTGEAFDYNNWDAGFPSSRNNHDHVEIHTTGLWRNINGANSTNDGYMVEWPVTWPATPPFPGGTE
jgi:hypothetical protein